METKSFGRCHVLILCVLLLSGVAYLAVFSKLEFPYKFSMEMTFPSFQKYQQSEVTLAGAEVPIPIPEVPQPPDNINQDIPMPEVPKKPDTVKVDIPITTKVENGIVTDPEGKTTFTKLLEDFEWNGYEGAVKAKNATLMKSYLESLIVKLAQFLAFEPIVPPNSTCKSPEIASADTINCSAYPSGFTGVKNNATVKLGVLIQFGFDVDVLEIYLNEVYDLVDQFFIIESTKAHQRTLIKPLLWEKVQFQPRFAKFAKKITHFVIDDAQSANVGARMDAKPGSDETMWLMEHLQEALRWKKFVEWNEARKVFSDDDVLGFGDADEIPSRKMVNMLRFCQLKGGMVDFGIWFPFGNIKLAFATDHPVRGHRFTLGDPGFWTLRAAKEKAATKARDNIPSRTHGHGPGGNYLLGGMHMTHYGYLPFQLVKHITATEGGPFGISEIQRISKKVTVKDIQALELELAAAPAQHKSRLANLTQISKEMKEIAILPWYYDCNRDRYPIWEGKHDTRLYLPIPVEK